MSVGVLAGDRVEEDDGSQMPFLARALDRHEAERELGPILYHLSGGGHTRLSEARLVRLKPGRRCLVEYEVVVGRPGEPTTTLALLGKARARGLDWSTYAVAKALWDGGFGSKAIDGIGVPEPVGTVPAFQMWLQRKVPGAPATQLLAGIDGVALARRVAEALHKLHQANVPTRRRHTMADELRILHERLPLVADLHPAWASRLERVLNACDRMGVATTEQSPRGIHRDFYADQLIVDGSRLYLLDFDLYCLGDPALDVGNFAGHLIEQALRTLGDPRGLADREEALVERFVELAGAERRPAIQAYTTLTLVRHIFLSTRFLERQACTQALLTLCEERLDVATRPAARGLTSFLPPAP